MLAVEQDRSAFDTLRYNLVDTTSELAYDWPAWFPKEPCEVGAFVATYASELAGLRGHVDLIAGGPPCQGFSSAGRRKIDDPRNELFRHYIEVVNLVRPPLLLLENVQGITLGFKGKASSRDSSENSEKEEAFSRRIKNELETLGYRVYASVVKAVEYGVPQLRPRYIIIGIDNALLNVHELSDPFELVRQIRSKFLAAKGLPADRPVTARDAISDLETDGRALVDCTDSRGAKEPVYGHPETHYQAMLHGSLNGVSPNSLRLLNHGKVVKARFARMLETCRRGVKLHRQELATFGLKKQSIAILDGNNPSHTLTSLPEDLLHYSEPRALTVREYARLQSFPDWFTFTGPYGVGGDRRHRVNPRYTRVANAVPPFVSEVMGLVLRDVWEELGYCHCFGDRVTQEANTIRDLTPYIGIIDAVCEQGGVGGTLLLAREERQRTVKRRMSLAAKKRGFRLVWRHTAGAELRFMLVKSSESER